MGFTEDDVQSLADKLDGLELTEGEHAALEAVLDAACAEDVAGFAWDAAPFAMRDNLRAILFFDEADAIFGKRTGRVMRTSSEKR